MLGQSCNKSSTFSTRKRSERNYNKKETYTYQKKIKFKNTLLKLSFCN